MPVTVNRNVTLPIIKGASLCERLQKGCCQIKVASELQCIIWLSAGVLNLSQRNGGKPFLIFQSQVFRNYNCEVLISGICYMTRHYSDAQPF